MPSPLPNPKNPSGQAERDAHGRFVKSAIPKVSVKVTGAAQIVTNPPAAFDEPILVVNNPFKRVLKWLDSIRRHQATTVAIKVTLPLIALPVIIYGLYRIFTSGFFGISTAVPTPAPTPLPTIEALPTTTPASQIVTKAGTLRMASGKYVLILPDGSVVDLVIPDTLLSSFKTGKKIIVTGLYFPATQTMEVQSVSTLAKPSPTPKPSITPSPTPTGTPTPTPTTPPIE